LDPDSIFRTPQEEISTPTITNIGKKKQLPYVHTDTNFNNYSNFVIVTSEDDNPKSEIQQVMLIIIDNSGTFFQLHNLRVLQTRFSVNMLIYILVEVRQNWNANSCSRIISHIKIIFIEEYNGPGMLQLCFSEFLNEDLKTVNRIKNRREHQKYQCL
jgi:hypothetical protein